MIDSLCTLDFASRLWGLFRGLIAGVLGNLQEKYGEHASEIMEHIYLTVKKFFGQVMQMDSFTLRLEAQETVN